MAKQLLSVILASFVLPLVAQAQMGGSITGQVSDQTGAALSAAEVVLHNIATQSEQSAVTDGAGRYEFNALSIGIYRLRVKKTRFSDAVRTVSLAEPGDVLEANFELTPGAVAEEITVTASRTERDVMEVPVRAEAITNQVIMRENPASTGDVLKDLPNLNLVNAGGSYLPRPRLRGLDSTRLVLLLDGERLNTSRVATIRAGPEIGLIDPTEVASIEVVYGSGSALYGTDALAGTVNVISDQPEPSADRLRVGGSFHGYFSSNETGRRGTGKLDVSGRQFAVRGSLMLERFWNYHAGQPFNESNIPNILRVPVFSNTEQVNPGSLFPPPDRVILQIFGGGIPDTFGQPFTRIESEIPNSQSHGSAVNTTFRYFPTATQSLRVKWTRRRNDAVGFPDFAPPFFFQFISIPFSNLDKASLRYEKSGFNSWFTRLTAGGYWQSQDRMLQNIIPVLSVTASDVRNLDTITSVNIFSQVRQNVKSFGYDVAAGFLIGAKNVLTAGVNYFRDHSVDSRLAITDVTTVGTANRVTGRFFRLNAPIVQGVVSHPVRVPRANFQNVGFFLENELDLTRWLRLLGSIRVDRIDVNSEPTPGYNPIPPEILDTTPPVDLSNLPPVSGTVEINRNAVTGNVGVVVRPKPYLSLTARVGRNFRHPNLEELFFSGRATLGTLLPNVNVEPEKSVNVDVAAKLRLSRFSGSVTYFNNTFTDFISAEAIGISSAGFVTQAGNFFKRLRIQGVEADWEVPLPVHTMLFTWFGNFGYLRGQILKGQSVLRLPEGLRETDVSNTAMPKISPFQSVAGLRWNDGSDRFWWEYKVRSVKRFNRFSPLIEFNPFKSAQDLWQLFGYSVHTVRGGYTFHRERTKLDVTLGLENLGNKFYRELFDWFPARGRSFTVGLSVRYF